MRFTIFGMVVWLAAAAVGRADVVVDLRQAGEVARWRAAHDVESIRGGNEGMVIRISGMDPFVNGPRIDLPAGQMLWMSVRLKSEQGGTLQVFYYRRGASEEDSVRAAVRPGIWEEVKLPVPALGAGYYLRIDPPGDGGKCVVQSIRFEERKVYSVPTWRKATAPAPQQLGEAVASGGLVVRPSSGEIGGFAVNFDEKPLAIGWNHGLVGLIEDGGVRWIELDQAKVEIQREAGAIAATASISDGRGGGLKLVQRFRAGQREGAIDADVELSADREREVLFAPLFGLCAGVGSFGEEKTQALFSGLEYLDKNEPSSSEADLKGEQANRLVPDELKITFPLMAVVGNGHYVGLIWEQQKDVAAVFDSPDRQLKSGGHLMGLIAPGSDGRNRATGAMLPYGPMRLSPDRPIHLRATIIAGRGTSVVDAVKHYVELHPLPAPPDAGDLQGYVKLAAAGWLDSKIRERNRYRHAWPGNFGLAAVTDAAYFMEWLADQSKEAALAGRLKEASEAALKEVPAAAYNGAAIGHVRYPVASLLYGDVAENVARAREHGWGVAKGFAPDGTWVYRPGKVNYGKTHFAPDANGLTANNVMAVLEAGSLSGDEALIKEGIRLLRAMDKFSNTVPRGAQTWEMPLHTPDILGAAYLVRAYLLGYQLTGEAHFLEEARYWGWTGVPFLYLTNPIADTNAKPVGLPYADIAVLGATNWQAPNWLGMPVQWCGLVYSDALYRLGQVDPGGPWVRIADGVTASGIEQTVPLDGPEGKRGLLPDSFRPRTATRNDPQINPGTVQANAIQLFTRVPLYQFVSARESGVLIHAPGAISQVKDAPRGVGFHFRPAIARRCRILVSRCHAGAVVKVNGKVAGGAVERYEKEGLLVLSVDGPVDVEIGFGGK